MKLKKISKKNKFKYILITIIFYFVSTYVIYYSFSKSKLVSNEKFITYLINNNESNFYDEYKYPLLLNKTIKYILNVDLGKPETFFNNTLIEYYSNSENITSNNDSDSIDIEHIKDVSSYMNDPYRINIEKPLVYLYNSHQLEEYNNDYLGIYGITPNVLMASYLFKEKLNRVGIPTIVEETNMKEFLTINNWDYSNAYRASRIFLLDKINTYPSLKYFIDIHRDSIKKEASTIIINTKSYAKILFVVGMEYNNWEKNYENVNKINNMINSKYPGISRGILKKSGSNVNGVYNQDINNNIFLIEVGGVDNNIDEVINTLNVLVDILKEYIGNNHE